MVVPEPVPVTEAEAVPEGGARRLLQEIEQILFIRFPMCTTFSIWQRLNSARSTHVQATRRAFVEACRHIKFVGSLHREQINDEGYFLHEHPQSASS